MQLAAAGEPAVTAACRCSCCNAVMLLVQLAAAGEPAVTAACSLAGWPLLILHISLGPIFYHNLLFFPKPLPDFLSAFPVPGILLSIVHYCILPYIIPCVWGVPPIVPYL